MRNGSVPPTRRKRPALRSRSNCLRSPTRCSPNWSRPMSTSSECQCTKYGPQIRLHEIERGHLRLGVVDPAGCDDEGRLLADNQALRPPVAVGKGPADTRNLVDP